VAEEQVQRLSKCQGQDNRKEKGFRVANLEEEGESGQWGALDFEVHYTKFQ